MSSNGTEFSRKTRAKRAALGTVATKPSLEDDREAGMRSGPLQRRSLRIVGRKAGRPEISVDEQPPSLASALGQHRLQIVDAAGILGPQVALPRQHLASTRDVFPPPPPPPSSPLLSPVLSDTISSSTPTSRHPLSSRASIPTHVNSKLHSVSYSKYERRDGSRPPNFVKSVKATNESAVRPISSSEHLGQATFDFGGLKQNERRRAPP